MKRIILLNLLKLSVLIVLVNFSKAETLNNNTAGGSSPVEPNRIPEILTMISNRTKSNYEQIKTWQGKADVIKDYIYEGDRAEKIFKTSTDGKGEVPSKIREHKETIIEFSLDAEKEFLYANYYSYSAKPQYTDFESGRDLGAKGILGRRIAIITPEYQLDCMGDTMRDGVVMSRRAVKQTRPKNSSTCCVGHPVYDPRKSLSIGDQIWEFFPRLVEYIKEHGKYSVGRFDLQVEERKTGDTNDYRIIMPSMMQGDGNYLFHEWVFSGDKGFNVVSFETIYRNERDSSNITFRREILEYERFDNVYVTCYKLEQTFDIPSGKLNKEMTITFKNQKVNRPIPEETFTYKNLGLQNGDKFIDKILNKEYTYQDGELIQASSGMEWEVLIIVASHWLDS